MIQTGVAHSARPVAGAHSADQAISSDDYCRDRSHTWITPPSHHYYCTRHSDIWRRLLRPRTLVLDEGDRKLPWREGRKVSEAGNPPGGTGRAGIGADALSGRALLVLFKVWKRLRLAK